MDSLKLFLLFTITLFLSSQISYAGELNLIKIDEGPEANNLTESSDFELFRYSKPTRDDLKTLCKLGIEEVMVLSGTAEEYELKNQDVCPQLKVVYNQEQESKIPLTAKFLNFFDNWVMEAKAKGKKIAFRCECGCHRTGRLAAYYQMKYQRLGLRDALVLMNEYGKHMWAKPYLDNQVRDLYAYIRNQPCKEEEKYCVNRDVAKIDL
ncbi:MAG: dual specificity protein phosphatase family protein [Bacteriovoracaceae bacterium]